MNIKDIPLIIPNYQQLSYLKSLVNQFSFYYPENPIYILDNGSTYEPLIDFYRGGLHGEIDDYEYYHRKDFTVLLYRENDFHKNLTSFLETNKFEYYIISDPDIMPHPATPPNFLEIFKHAIDHYGFHHAGFDLITEDIPDWNKKKAWIQGDEKALHGIPVEIEYEGQKYQGWKAALDTTFALYKRDNGGWQAPQSAENWTNSLRLFKAYHLTWYIHPNHVNEEMKHYFATCKKFEPGQISAGKNNYRCE